MSDSEEPKLEVTESGDEKVELPIAPLPKRTNDEGDDKPESGEGGEEEEDEEDEEEEDDEEDEDEVSRLGGCEVEGCLSRTGGGEADPKWVVPGRRMRTMTVPRRRR